jgi:hypothetical protein
MTIQIPKAQAGEGFAERVETFRHAKLAHHRTIGVPAPVEHPLVEASLKRLPREGEADDYVADYQIVEPSLDQQKKDLIATVGKLQQAALIKEMSPGKRIMLSFQVADMANKENTPADKIIIAKFQLLLAHGNAVSRHAAKLCAQIEDLTDETIKTWKPEAFPQT